MSRARIRAIGAEAFLGGHASDGSDLIASPLLSLYFIPVLCVLMEQAGTAARPHPSLAGRFRHSLFPFST